MKYLMMWRRHFDSFESMPDELVGQIVKSMGREAFEYGNPMESGADRMVLVSFVNDAREAREKAYAKSRKNSEAGKAGAEKRWAVETVEHPKNVVPMPQGDDSLRLPTAGKSPLSVLIDRWNSLENLPHCPFTAANLPKQSDAVTQISARGEAAICKAMENLNKHWGKVEPRFRPKSCENFLANSVGNWVDEASPDERFAEEESEKDIIAREIAERRRQKQEAQA